MAKWEYMMTGEHDRRRPHKYPNNETNPGFEISMEEWLNQLGSEGWEVVAAGGAGAGSEYHNDLFFTIILKREISD